LSSVRISRVEKCRAMTAAIASPLALLIASNALTFAGGGTILAGKHNVRRVLLINGAPDAPPRGQARHTRHRAPRHPGLRRKRPSRRNLLDPTLASRQARPLCHSLLHRARLWHPARGAGLAHGGRRRKG